MKILVAMDSYKESISAVDACRAVAEGLRAADADVTVVEVPLSDGGEGMLDCLSHGADWKRVQAAATGLMGGAILGEYAVKGETAVIETAVPCGLASVPYGERDPMVASSRGVGDLVRAALNAGYRDIVIALGGSGCSDGGMGALVALGAEFYDEKGVPLAPSGAAMEAVRSADLSGLVPALAEARIRLAADVTNPYCGPKGAARVYAPQKGATTEMVERLDAGLDNLAACLVQAGGKDVKDLPGAGAAGGLGGGFFAVADCEMQSGFTVVAEAVSLAEKIAEADFVITGEGKTDEQTAYGKLPMRVSLLAEAAGKPAFCLSGALGAGAKALHACGMTGVRSISDRPMALSVAMERTAELLADAAEFLLRTALAFAPAKKKTSRKKNG